MGAEEEKWISVVGLSREDAEVLDSVETRVGACQWEELKGWIPQWWRAVEHVMVTCKADLRGRALSVVVGLVEHTSEGAGDVREVLIQIMLAQSLGRTESEMNHDGERTVASPPTILKWVDDDDLRTSSLAARVFGNVLAAQSKNGPRAGRGPTLEGFRKQFFSSICRKLCGLDVDDTCCVGYLQGIARTLRSDAARMDFASVSISHPGSTTPLLAITCVAELLDQDQQPPVHVTYQVLFVLWLMSFARDPSVVDAISQALDSSYVPRRLILLIRDVSTDKVSPKVVRLTVATLRNLATKNFSARLRREMVGAGLVTILNKMGMRNWQDSDVEEDLIALKDAVSSELQMMSTFEVYRHELLSGALEWSPVHNDEQFWRQNVEKMEANKNELPTRMATLIKESKDATILAVACHDLQQFIKCHPRGRKIVQYLNVKGRLMELMSDPEQDPVRLSFRSLLSCFLPANVTEP
uniref:ATPase V1 complex subunit H C-terminal domain-containing protein n=1 Tax=Compsopogon caeruleus TaxID=31354 RepID=A0A7S1T8Q0_9RHOD|mmetsp:Transcript_12732/g.25833  ORF Transcript_12732/g.25833 Transcript_12732/m.25833 type:complete len:469 (+) Transcript_12732:68-1474(+)